eukprot:gene10582-biopygen1773
MGQQKVWEFDGTTHLGCVLSRFSLDEVEADKEQTTEADKVVPEKPDQEEQAAGEQDAAGWPSLLLAAGELGCGRQSTVPNANTRSCTNCLLAQPVRAGPVFLRSAPKTRATVFDVRSGVPGLNIPWVFDVRNGVRCPQRCSMSATVLDVRNGVRCPQRCSMSATVFDVR